MTVANRKKYQIALIVITGMVLSMYFYSQFIHMETPLHSDDAATAIEMREVVEAGTRGWDYWIRPLRLLNGLLYLAMGPGRLFLQFSFTIKYFLCVTTALFLAVNIKGKFVWWLLPCFVFFCLPGNYGVTSMESLKSHVWTQLVPLICLAYVLARGNNVHALKKKDILILACLSALGLIERDILVIVTCWIPFFLYGALYFVQSGHAKKCRKNILIAGMLILLLGRVFSKAIEYKGYGSGNFPNPNVVAHNFAVMIRGLLDLFNIYLINNNVMRFQTVIYGIRLVLLCCTLWFVISVIKDIKRKKIEQVGMVEAVLAIGFPVLTAAYLFGGTRTDVFTIRYMAYAYYAFPVLFCRKLSAFVDERQFEWKTGRCRINLLVCFFIVCIAVTMDPISYHKKECRIDRLVEQMSEICGIKYGMGSFWTAGVTSCLSDYEMEVQPAHWSSDKTIIPYLNKRDAYGSGNRNYNFFLEDQEAAFGITESNLSQCYGPYKKKYEIEDAKANVYLYDYDVRTAPLKITPADREHLMNYDDLETEGSWLKLEAGESAVLGSLYVSVGKVRVSVFGSFAEGSIEISSGEEIDIREAAGKRNLAVYEVEADQLYESLRLEVKNTAEDAAKIRDIRIERLENCRRLPVQQEYQLDLSPGYYIFGVEGDEVKNTELAFELDGTGLTAERINNGCRKTAYGVKIPESGKLHISASYKGSVAEVFYQNEVRSSFHHPSRKVYTAGNGIQQRKSQGLLFGPYENLQPGVYDVDVYGEGLDRADIRFTYDAGDAQLENVISIQNGGRHSAYRLELAEELESFEVLISDVRQDGVKVDYYTLTKTDGGAVKNVNLSYPYYNSHIYTSDADADRRGAVLLQKDEFCYGPYANLPGGVYRLVVSGSNLSNARVGINVQSGQKEIEDVTVNKRSPKRLEMDFTLEDTAEDFEVVIYNGQDEECAVRQYTIRSVAE